MHTWRDCSSIPSLKKEVVQYYVFGKISGSIQTLQLRFWQQILYTVSTRIYADTLFLKSCLRKAGVGLDWRLRLFCQCHLAATGCSLQVCGLHFACSDVVNPALSAPCLHAYAAASPREGPHICGAVAPTKRCHCTAAFKRKLVLEVERTSNLYSKLLSKECFIFPFFLC